MTAHLVPVPALDGRALIDSGAAVCGMKGQARDYWPAPDPLDVELAELLEGYGKDN